ncbi:hypothetical protein ACRDNQ_04045 [Palleronia sp. KMU-117]|uniref:hypothetical protein n=1 Tax=Palleronia sp. KMU-117 TaxID=3434108 RepID=UPI003D71C4BD
MASEAELANQIKSLERSLDRFIRESERSDVQMRADINYIKERVTELKVLVTDHYVPRIEFEPVKKLVYGVVTLALTGVIGSLMALILRQ